MKVHPVAELFPMLPDDELDALAADIKERGQLQPIIVDDQKRVIDGRNRLAACARAGVEPQFVAYQGDDPGGYALAVNVARRHLRPSQMYMIKEMARRVNGSGKLLISSSEAEAIRLSEAASILDHAPDLARSVADGLMPLHKAVEIARENKQKAKAEAMKRDRLKTEASDLLALVDDDQLGLDEAIGALDSRLSKAEVERRRIEDERERDKRLGIEAVQQLNVELLANVATILGAVQSGAAIDIKAVAILLDRARQAVKDVANV